MTGNARKRYRKWPKSFWDACVEYAALHFGYSYAFAPRCDQVLLFGLLPKKGLQTCQPVKWICFVSNFTPFLTLEIIHESTYFIALYVYPKKDLWKGLECPHGSIRLLNVVRTSSSQSHITYSDIYRELLYVVLTIVKKSAYYKYVSERRFWHEEDSFWHLCLSVSTSDKVPCHQRFRHVTLCSGARGYLPNVMIFR